MINTRGYERRGAIAADVFLVEDDDDVVYHGEDFDYSDPVDYDDPDLDFSEVDYYRKNGRALRTEKDGYDKLTGYNGLVTWYRIRGRKIGFSEDDYVRSILNSKYNKRMGFVRANRGLGKAVDPRVLAKRRKVEINSFMPNPLISWLQDRWNHDILWIKTNCDYYVTDKGKLSITHIGDMPAEDYKLANGYYDDLNASETDDDDAYADKKVRLDRDMVLLSVLNKLVSLLHEYRLARLSVASREYLANKYNIHHNTYLTSADLGNLRKLILRTAGVMLPEHHYRVDFKGLILGAYDDFDIDTIANKIEFIKVVHTPSTINGNNGSFTNTDDHDLRVVFLVNTDPLDLSFVHVLCRDQDTRGVYMTHLFLSYLCFSDTEFVTCQCYSNDTTTYVISGIPKTCIQQALRETGCGVAMMYCDNTPMSVHGVVVYTSVWTEGWYRLCNLHKSGMPHSLRGSNDLRREFDAATIVLGRAEVVFSQGRFHRVGDPNFSMFGPAYSSDNAGDGPEVRITQCADHNCSKAIHYHRRKSNANPAARRVAAATRARKSEEVVDLWKTHLLCGMGCMDSHSHLITVDDITKSSTSFAREHIDPGVVGTLGAFDDQVIRDIIKCNGTTKDMLDRFAGAIGSFEVNDDSDPSTYRSGNNWVDGWEYDAYSYVASEDADSISETNIASWTTDDTNGTNKLIINADNDTHRVLTTVKGECVEVEQCVHETVVTPQSATVSVGVVTGVHSDQSLCESSSGVNSYNGVGHTVVHKVIQTTSGARCDRTAHHGSKPNPVSLQPLAILSDDGNYFSVRTNDLYDVLASKDLVYGIWEKSKTNGLFYRYHGSTQSIAGHPWPYGTHKAGYINGYRYNEHSLCLTPSRKGCDTLAMPELTTIHLCVELRDVEFFRKFRAGLSSMVKGVDALGWLDDTTWDDRSIDYLRVSKYVDIVVSTCMVEHLSKFKTGTGFTDNTQASLFNTLVRVFPESPTWVIVTSLLHHTIVKLNTTLSLCAMNKACASNFTLNNGDHSCITAVLTTNNKSVAYLSVDRPNVSSQHGWHVDDRVSLVSDSRSSRMLVIPYTYTDGESHGSYDYDYKISCTKFAMIKSSNVVFNGGEFKFMSDPVKKTFDINANSLYFAGLGTICSIVDARDDGNGAIAAKRFLMDRPGESSLRHNQSRLTECALIIFGFDVYKMFGVNGLAALQRIHDNVCRDIRGACKNHKYEDGTVLAGYDYDVLGINGGSMDWASVKTMYYDGVLSRSFLVEHMKYLEFGEFACNAALIASQLFAYLSYDDEFAIYCAKAEYDPPASMREYFVSIGGPKLNLRLQLLDNILKGEPEYRTITTNTVCVKPYEMQKMKRAKYGGNKGKLTTQYARTVVSITGEPYVEGRPDLISGIKHMLSGHPLLYSSSKCHVLGFDANGCLYDTGVSNETGVYTSRCILVCSATDDSNSRDLSALLTTLLRYSDGLGDCYIGVSFGDDMLSYDTRDKLWSEQDISSNDGSYTDGLARCVMYVSGFLTKSATDPAFAQCARDYYFPAPSKYKDSWVIFRSLCGMTLPSGSVTTTLRCTHASMMIHVMNGFNRSINQASAVTGFILSGLENKVVSNAVGFLSNVIHHDDVTNQVICVLHLGVLFRSWGISKRSAWTIGREYGRNLDFYDQGFVFTSLLTLSSLRTYNGMYEDRDDIPRTFYGTPVIPNRHNGYFGVPTIVLCLCAVLEACASSKFQWSNTIIRFGNSARSRHRLVVDLRTAAAEYRHRITLGSYDFTDLILCRGYATCVMAGVEYTMAEVLVLYEDCMKGMLNTPRDIYGCTYTHKFIDMCMLMRYGAEGVHDGDS